MTEYLVPTKSGEAELAEKRSRFIGRVWRAETEEIAREYIESIKKKHHDARHNCWCYIIKDGPVRYSDDGEPQGTAGQPMLNVFEREGMVNACCVVTRYFGGILLGAGGLTRAYAQIAKQALDAAGISVVRRWLAADISCTYAQFEGVRREVAAFGGMVEDTAYGADVVVSALLPEGSFDGFAAHILDCTAGSVQALQTGERWKDVPRCISRPT